MSGALSLISSAAAFGAELSGSTIVLLGPVPFTSWEIPEEIAFGGSQMTHIHKMPGGARRIDAMGADPDNIAWKGTFIDLPGNAKARLLDVMRMGGQPWTLAWSTFNYQVVIKEFKPVYVRETWIPYTISCEVIQDRAAALITAGLSLLSSAVSDVGSALGLSLNL
jgi:hypothetical protein